MKKMLIAALVVGSLTGVAVARDKPHWPTRPRIPAPELNPASIGSAMTLLLGGLTVLRSRVGKK